MLGLGIMGGRIAHRLVDSNVALKVWNRDPAKAEPLAALGAEIACSPAEAVRDCGLVILMLSDEIAVREVLWEKGAAAAMSAAAIVVDMSSIPPGAAKEHARKLAASGQAHLDAPVSGGVLGAEEGTLAIFVGGEVEPFAQASPILELLGHPTHMGSSGAGQIAKAVNQLIVGITIGATAEGLTLAMAAGADALAVREALLGGFADSRVLREHGRRMLENDFVAGGRNATQLKDLRTARALAVEHGLTLPLTECATQTFEALVRAFGPDLDHSSVILELKRASRVSDGV